MTQARRQKPEGKRVDVHRYERDGHRLAIPIYMRKQFSGTRFAATVPEHSIEVDDPSIDRVRALLDERLASALAMTWTPMLLVTVDHQSQERRRQGAILKISYDRLEIGVAGARTVHRFTRDDGKPGFVMDGSPKTDGYEPVRSFYGDFDTTDGARALVADTPENRVALDGIIAAMLAMQAKLTAMLSPTAAQGTLARIASKGVSLLASVRTESQE